MKLLESYGPKSPTNGLLYTSYAERKEKQRKIQVYKNMFLDEFQGFSTPPPFLCSASLLPTQEKDLRHAENTYGARAKIAKTTI